MQGSVVGAPPDIENGVGQESDERGKGLLVVDEVSHVVEQDPITSG